MNDLYFSSPGDFFLGPEGDLADTGELYFRGLLQRIDTRVMSSPGDWKADVSIGAGLTDFLGKPNSAALGDEIKNRVHNELLKEDLLRPGEFKVDVIPFSKTVLVITLSVKPPGQTGQIVRLYSYSLNDNKIYLRSV